MAELEELKAVDIQTISREDLVDVCTLPEDKVEYEDTETRIKAFVERVKNPYCFMVDGIVVKSTFSGNVRLEERLREMAKKI